MIALLALGIISSYPSMAGKATSSNLAMVILFHEIRIPAIQAAQQRQDAAESAAIASSARDQTPNLHLLAA